MFFDHGYGARMSSADLRARREAVVREHMESENSHDFDTTIATFGHPRYELVATGDVYDGADAVRAYFAEWVDTLTAALDATGAPEPRSRALQLFATIQGGIILARALNDPDAFDTAINSARVPRDL